MAARFRRIRAGARTREIVSWSIGVLVMLGLALAVRSLADHLGWSWP